VRTGKLISALVVTSAFIGIPAVTGAPVAHATAGDVVCSGGFLEANAAPGLTFQTKTIQITGQGDMGQCHSLGDSTVAGGTLTFQATVQGECPNGGNGNGSGVITWNNGKTSNVQGTFVIDQNQVGLSSIHVVSGEFQGDSGSFAGPITYLPWYECLFPTGVEYGRSIINEAFLNDRDAGSGVHREHPGEAGSAPVVAVAGRVGVVHHEELGDRAADQVQRDQPADRDGDRRDRDVPPAAGEDAGHSREHDEDQQGQQEVGQDVGGGAGRVVRSGSGDFHTTDATERRRPAECG
jgi:hypothetical protein